MCLKSESAWKARSHRIRPHSTYVVFDLRLSILITTRASRSKLKLSLLELPAMVILFLKLQSVLRNNQYRSNDMYVNIHVEVYFSCIRCLYHLILRTCVCDCNRKHCTNIMVASHLKNLRRKLMEMQHRRRGGPSQQQTRMTCSSPQMHWRMHMVRASAS